ncbi:MAG: type II secretion system protein GspM, partial [Thiothrix sp.]
TLLWLLVWKPLSNHRQLLQQDLEDARAVYSEMQARRAEILALRNNSNALSATNGSLHTAVISTLERFQLDGEGTSSEETDKNTVSLQLENKPFDALAQFLAAIESEQAAKTTRMTLKPAAKPGTVNAELTLER